MSITLSISMNTTKILSVAFRRRLLRALTLSLAAGILIQSLIVWHVYTLASAHLDANDPRQLQNRSEITFYLAPLKLKREMPTSVSEIAAYLNDLSYKQSSANLPGSYQIVGEKLQIRSINPGLFPDAELFVKHKKLASIKVSGRDVHEVELEPLQLQDVVDYLDPNSVKRDLRTRRIVIVPGSLPKLVNDAVTTAEDKNFFTNPGVEWFSLAFRPILSLGGQGGSTISQQLIKNNIIEGARDEFWQLGIPAFDSAFAKFERKIAEVPMALKLNQMMSKDEILAAYLSMNYMGTVAGVDLQGFAAASHEYFRTSIFEVSDRTSPVDVARACTLAGMIQNPGAYLKFVKQGEKCETSQKQCLDLRRRRDKIMNLLQENNPDTYPKELIERAKQEPLGLSFASSDRQSRPIQAESRNFASFAASSGRLPEEISRLRGAEGQVKVITTLDPVLQRIAVDMINKAESNIQSSVDRAYRKQRLKNEEAFAQIERECMADEKRRREGCDDLFKVQASLVAVDAQSGDILAMSTGVAPTSKRSPGSLIKPFFYLKALESGELKGSPFTSATFIDPAVDTNMLADYCAEDENLGHAGTVRRHLSRSWNLGACLASQSAGIPTEFVGSLTGSQPEKKLIAALGGTKGSEVSLPDMVQGFTIFPNNGKLVRLSAYKRAQQSAPDGFRPVEITKSQLTAVADPAATFVTTQLMRSVVEDGTAAGFETRSGMNAGSVAGKSGSGMVADLWWISVTPRIVVGVWVGMPHNLPELRMAEGFTGGNLAAPLAADFMRAAANYRGMTGNFIMPSNVVMRYIDPRFGCQNRNGNAEYFISGREPKDCR